MEIITREAAQQKGQVWFFTGAPCSAGHFDKCYVVSGRCYTCHRERHKADYARYPERHKAASAADRKKYKAARVAAGARWAAANREKSNGIKKAWKLRHREQHLALGRKYQAEKCARDPVYRLGCRLSKAIWYFLKGGKAGRKWVDLVGYDLEDLKQHVERLFTADMTWTNYGEVWELDHRRPKSWFTGFETPEAAVKAAWALDNLQPLPVAHNRSKGNKYAN